MCAALSARNVISSSKDTENVNKRRLGFELRLPWSMPCKRFTMVGNHSPCLNINCLFCMRLALVRSFDNHVHVKLLVSEVCSEAEHICAALSAHEVISTSLDTKQVIDMSY